MATGLAVAKEFKKPMDPDDESKGSVTYKMVSAADPKGLFVSTYYFRDTDCVDCQAYRGQDQMWVKTDIYKTGLVHYLKVTESQGFEGWKLLIYTDALSIENPVFKNTADKARHEKHWREWREILQHPNVVFGIVDWPEYAVGKKTDGKTIDNAILRALRMKAFHDFSDIPVFVRDADTLFENILKVRDMSAELAAWELAFKKELERISAPPSEYKMIIASQPNYHRQWHMHPESGVQTTGCYAAVTSTLGGIPEWADGSIWRNCLAYLRKFSTVVNMAGERTPSNIGKPTYIGKDEQLLSYVVLPAIFKKIYFYYLEYIQVEGTKIVMTAETPFADELIKKGYDRYPSPYMVSLGEPLLPLEESALKKRKDENEKTETTILNPKIIPLSLAKETHDILQTIFQFFLNKIKAAKTLPTPATLPQAGGGKRRRRVKRRTRRNRRKRLRAGDRGSRKK